MMFHRYSREPFATHSGTNHPSGPFRSDTILGLADDNYSAEIVDLALATLDWNQLDLDWEDDADGDCKPDELLTV